MHAGNTPPAGPSPAPPGRRSALGVKITTPATGGGAAETAASTRAVRGAAFSPCPAPDSRVSGVTMRAATSAALAPGAGLDAAAASRVRSLRPVRTEVELWPLAVVVVPLPAAAALHGERREAGPATVPGPASVALPMRRLISLKPRPEGEASPAEPPVEAAAVEAGAVALAPTLSPPLLLRCRVATVVGSCCCCCCDGDLTGAGEAAACAGVPAAPGLPQSMGAKEAGESAIAA
jgi:hypothetical protein